MPTEHVVLATVVEFDQERMGVGRSLLAVMHQQLPRVRPRLPAVHPRRQRGQQVHAAIPAGLVAADRLEALAPEELERPRHFLNAGEAIVVPGAWLPRLLALVGAGHAEPRVLGELAQEVFDVVWLERHVRVEIADELVGNMLDPRGPRVERMHLAGEVTLLPLA